MSLEEARQKAQRFTERMFPTEGHSNATGEDVRNWIENNWHIHNEGGKPVFTVDYSLWKRYLRSIGMFRY